MADIFVSYTSSDQEWAFWIDRELRALDHTPHVHDLEIAGGDDIYAWMEARHDAADHVLCVMSDEYLKAPYSKLERNAAAWQAAKKRPGFLLLVEVKACTLPSLLDHYRHCKLFDAPEDAARLRFREFMAGRSKTEPVTFPGSVVAVSNIPIRVPTLFMGREAALDDIERALRRYEGRVAITALQGMQGVGKTVLAAAYADRHRNGYRATWWLRAQTEAGLRTDLMALGVRLGWVRPDEKEEPALAAVMERLRHEGEGILLIYDNATDANALNPYLPRGGLAHVLVTSNSHAWRRVAEQIEIRLWPEQIGADYLIARTGRAGERAAAEELSEMLGGLPLAHEQAAAYCERLEIPIAEYLHRFKAAPIPLLGEGETPEYDRLTVARAFTVAIDEAAKLHPAAEPLIVHAALLAPEPIPLFLFAGEGRKKFGEPLCTLLANGGRDEAVAALRAFALVDRESIPDERNPALTTDSIRLHRLVREVCAARYAGEAQERARRALIEALAAVYPHDVFSDLTNWPQARRLDALALALAGGDAELPEGSEVPASDLMDKLALYRYVAIADYAQARQLFERALAIRMKVLGSDHPDTAQSLNNLALLRRAQGDLPAARTLFERALAIREKLPGPGHTDTAQTLNNLASLLRAQGDLPAAREYCERALAIYEQECGPDDPHTATSRIILAAVLNAQGEHDEAMRLAESALAIYEKTFKSDHPAKAACLTNLATVFQGQGDFAAARPLFKRALAINEQALGPDHPNTAMSLNSLGSLLQADGDPVAARKHFERALAITEQALGPDHPYSTVVRTNLAALMEQGR